MTAFFLIILGVPLLVAGAAFVFLSGITWKEFGLIILAQLIVAGSSAGICSCANTHDVEILSGRVTGKTRDVVSCSHSYDCNCHEVCSGTGKNRSCHEHCDTCYEHSFDVDWDVQSTVGGFEINRVDRQGLGQPPRWASTIVGEPVVNDHSYDNYVKAAPGTLFRHQGLMEKYAASLPDNPQNIYDYWHVNRLVTVGTGVPEGAAAWNHDLMELNADLGATKQANIIVVIVKNQSLDWYSALEEKWIGGKKNDVVLVVSVDDAWKPQWASVMCWTTNELFKVQLRDAVMSEPTLTKDGVMADLRTNVAKYFTRKPMKDFEYLSSSITPSTTEWVVTLIIGLIVAVGLIVFFQVNDVFDEEEYHNGIFTELSTSNIPGLPRTPRRRRRNRYGTSGGGPF